MICACCKEQTAEVLMVPHTDAQLCRKCERLWLLAPESARLRAISLSLFSEWVERLRVEAIVEKQKDQGVVG